MAEIHPSRLLKLKINQIFMIRDRGYDIKEEARVLEMGPAEFITYYTQKARENGVDTLYQALSNTYTNREGSTLLVYYARFGRTSKFLGVDEVKTFFNQINDKGVTSAILISSQALSTKAKDTYTDIPIKHIQHFLDDELFYNVTHHYMVPHHRAMSAEEAKAFLTTNSLQPSKFPILRWEDPVAKWYGFIPGQIIEISRLNLATETLVDDYKSYRVVDEPSLEKKSR